MEDSREQKPRFTKEDRARHDKILAASIAYAKKHDDVDPVREFLRRTAEGSYAFRLGCLLTAMNLTINRTEAALGEMQEPSD